MTDATSGFHPGCLPRFRRPRRSARGRFSSLRSVYETVAPGSQSATWLASAAATRCKRETSSPRRTLKLVNVQETGWKDRISFSSPVGIGGRLRSVLVDYARPARLREARGQSHQGVAQRGRGRPRRRRAQKVIAVDEALSTPGRPQIRAKSQRIVELR